MLFQMISAQSKIHTASSIIRIRDANSISYDDNYSQVAASKCNSYEYSGRSSILTECVSLYIMN